MAIKPPIFLDDNGDLSIFLSVEDAIRYLEPEDLEPGRDRLCVYDSEGRLMLPVRLTPDGRFERAVNLPGRKMGLVSADEEPPCAAALATRIREFLGYMGYAAADLERDPLPQLVETSIKYAARS